jgi:hypothetical protein
MMDRLAQAIATDILIQETILEAVVLRNTDGLVASEIAARISTDTPG